MRIGMRLFVVDAFAVEGVDAYLPRSVDDASVAKTDADVCDRTVGRLGRGRGEECEVVALDVARAYLDTAGGLL